MYLCHHPHYAHFQDNGKFGRASIGVGTKAEVVRVSAHGVTLRTMVGLEVVVSGEEFTACWREEET